MERSGLAPGDRIGWHMRGSGDVMLSAFRQVKPYLQTV